MNDYTKFSRRPGTTNFGTTFEILTTASLLLNLTLDENIKNFRLTSNDAEFGNFDDIVVEVELLNGHVNRYAIQVKYSSDERQFRKKSLLSSRGNFSIQNYFRYFLHMAEFTKCYNLILFTNLKLYFEEGQTLNLEGSNISLEIREENLPSEFGDGFCYRFYPTVDVSDEHRKFFERFCIYSNHLNIRKMENNLLARFDAKFSCNNVDNYLKFISEWSNKTGRVKKLDKRYMKEIIALQILKTSIKSLPYVENKNNNVTLLKKAILNFNLTVVDQIYFEQVKMIWENEPATPGKTEKIINELYLKNLNDNEKQAIALWITNKCPLIVTESDTVVKAINFCHEKKFILLKSTLTPEIKPYLHVFTKLSDLKKFNLTLYQEIAKTFQCSIQGKGPITLEDLIEENQHFENIITVNELMQMLSQPLRIGLQENVLDIYIERAITRIVISYNFFDGMDTDTLVVISCEGRINKLKNCLKNFKFVDVEKEELSCDKLEQANLEKTVYISQYQCSQETFENICRRNGRKKNIHHFKLCEDELLEWIYSKGEINDLQKYKSDLYFIREEDLINHELQHGVNIITGNPGMGKTQLMKKLTFNYPPSVWTIFVSAKMWSEYLKNNNEEKIFIHYLMRNNCKSNFEQEMFRIMYHARSIIFFWDGLDELSNSELESVIEKIKVLSRNNLKQWISCRKHLKNKLEKIFNTLSRTIAPFNKDQQSAYIQKRLITTEIDLEDVIQKIQHHIINVQSNEILGVPLQIFMLTELFLNSPRNVDILSNDLFPVTELYKHFIEMKIQIYITDKGHLQEFNVVIEELIKVFRRECLKFHQKAALITVIEDKFLQELNIDTHLDISDEESFYRVGLITGRASEGKLQFVHHSYAEYFTALYLFEHRNRLKTLIKKIIFQNNYRNIRFMFDLFLAKDCPAHLAVLYNNLEYLNRCEDYIRKDQGGRNPLQIACSWGARYPLLKNGQENDISIIDDDLINISHTPNYDEMLNLLLKYNDTKEKDLLFSMDSIQYADLSLSFKAITILLQHESFSFDILNNFSDLNTVVYYSIKFDYANVLDFINTRFFKTQKTGYTALHMASMSNSISCAQILLNNHLLHINDTQNLYGETPVFLASQNGHHKMVYLLVQSGAGINIPRNDGSTPLHAAAKNGHMHVVRLLIYLGWNLDAKTNKGCTPIYLATQNGHYEIVKYLAEMGADINIPQQDCFVPIHVAAGNGHLELVILLTDLKSDVNATSKTGTTPIYLAAQEGHYHVVKFLIELKADVNIPQQDGFLPVHIAAQKGHIKVVQLMIELNCDVNAKTNKGCTPIYLAAQKGHYEVVKYLAESRADVNISQRNGFLPIHVASANGHCKVLEHLINLNGGIYAQSNEGFTPVYLAAQRGHYEIVKLLVMLGGNINIPQKDGFVPIHIAARNGYVEIVKFLAHVGGDINAKGNKEPTPIYLAVQEGRYDVVKCLIELGADVNISQQDGYIPLHVAAARGHIEIVKLLIDFKSNVNLRSNKGITPIYLAAQQGHLDVIKYLVKSKADVNIPQQDGFLPIHIAAQKGHIKVVQLMIELKCDVNAKTNKGYTPIYLAAQKGHYELVNLLTKLGSVKCNENCTPTNVGIQAKNEKLMTKLNTYATLDEMMQLMSSMEMEPS